MCLFNPICLNGSRPLEEDCGKRSFPRKARSAKSEKETKDETNHHVTRWMWAAVYRWQKRKSSSVIFGQTARGFNSSRVAGRSTHLQWPDYPLGDTNVK